MFDGITDFFSKAKHKVQRLLWSSTVEAKEIELKNALTDRLNSLYNDRYLIATATTPVAIAMKYIANVIKELDIVIMQDDKTSDKKDTIINDSCYQRNKVSKNYPNLFLTPDPVNQPSINQTIEILLKDYFLNGCYTFFVDIERQTFRSIPCDVLNIDSIQENYNKNINTTITYLNETFTLGEVADVLTLYNQNKQRKIIILEKKPKDNYYSNCILSGIILPISMYNFLSNRNITKASQGKMEAIISVMPENGHEMTTTQEEVLKNTFKNVSQRFATVIGSNVNVSPLPGGLDGIDILSAISKATEEIYQIFGLNPALLTSERSSYNNVNQSGVNFINHTILPIASMIYKDISMILRDEELCKVASNIKAYIEIDKSKISELEGQKIQKAQTMYGMSGIFTTNEIRDVLGKEALENGDAIARADGLEMKVVKEESKTKKIN
jgi:hypothetical protein